MRIATSTSVRRAGIEERRKSLVAPPSGCKSHRKGARTRDRSVTLLRANPGMQLLAAYIAGVGLLLDPRQRDLQG